MERSARLDRMLSSLQGCCPVCFTLKNEIRHCETPFVSCVGRDDLMVASHDQECRRFKKMFKWKPYHYCFFCFLPLDRNFNGQEPQCHRKYTQSYLNADRANEPSGSSGSERSKRQPCPWADFVPLAVYTIYASNRLRPAFALKFGFPRDLRLAEFQQWAAIEESGRGQFWNGLEMFLAIPEYWEAVQNMKAKSVRI